MRYKPSDTIKDPEVYRELLRTGQLLFRTKADALVVYNVEPEKSQEGDIVICDGINWNPIGDGIKRPVWFDGTDWQKFDL